MEAVQSPNPQPGTEEFLDEDGKWQCTACGACCEDVRWCLPHWMVPGTTRCKHFDTETRLCKIYDERPAICRMDAWQNPPDEVMAKACAFMRNAQYAETPEDSE